MNQIITDPSSRFMWIEYLRAIAVLSVLLFHLELFEFGYLGVELFFIVSGYLILPRLLKISDNSKVIAYWIKRTLRLGLPQIGCFAFIVILVAFFPSEIQRDFGQSLFAAIFRAVNIKFWLEADYWAASSLYKPLLHFWSLAVEEQFYAIVFMVLLVLNQLKVIHLFPLILAAMAIAGCLTSIFLDASANFYLIFSRFYLFILGFYFALGRYYPGFLICIACIFLFMVSDVYNPKILEIIPVLIFLVGHAINKISNPAFQSSAVNSVVRYVGSRSYCIYLVHWPLIVGWRIFFGSIQAYEIIITVLVMIAAEILYQLFDKHHDKLAILFNNVPSNVQAK